MKKMLNSFFLFLIIFSFSILNVKADNIDPSLVSSLTIHHQYDDINISDTSVSIYFLASMDSSGKYQFQNDYLDVEFDVSDMTVSEINLKAKEVFSYINSRELDSFACLKTKDDGTSYFSNLVPGLYLISIDNKAIGDFLYKSLPMLVSIPTLENGKYQYDVLVNTKIEKEKIEHEVTPPGVNGNGEMVPNTLDNIYLYIGLLIISFLIIVGVMIYIIRRKGEKNEKNE